MTVDTAPLDIERLGENAERASALLKSMANNRRLMVLCQLANGQERSVGELEELVGISQSALSQHLARLRQDKLVKTRRSGQVIYYSLAGAEARAIIDTLHELYCD